MRLAALSRQVHEELFGQPVGPGPNPAGNEDAGEVDGEREEAGVVSVGQIGLSKLAQLKRLGTELGTKNSSI